MVDTIGPMLITLLVVVVVVVVLFYVRSYLSADPNKTARHAAQSRDMADYIKSAKAKDQEAWTNVMTVMGEDDRDLPSVYMNTTHSEKLRGRTPKQKDEGVDEQYAPLNDFQRAFFSFWKIPASRIPGNNRDANHFIETYKDKLRNDGYTHRVRRWGRLEIMMGRFNTDYDVSELNDKCYDVGINRPIMDVLLAQTMTLLNKKVLQWRDIATEEAYQIVVQQLSRSCPQLTLMRYKLGK